MHIMRCPLPMRAKWKQAMAVNSTSFSTKTDVPMVRNPQCFHWAEWGRKADLEKLQEGRDFLTSCWLYFTFIKVCEYCAWPETLYNFIFHFGNFEAHPLVRMCMPLTDCLVKHYRDTLSPDIQLQFDIWVLHWWMSKPQLSCFLSHSEGTSWNVGEGSTGGKPAMDTGLYH